MPTWSKTHHRRRRAERRRIHKKGYAFHQQRVARLIVSGREDELRTSGFVRRQARKLRRAPIVKTVVAAPPASIGRAQEQAKLRRGGTAQAGWYPN